MEHIFRLVDFNVYNDAENSGSDDGSNNNIYKDTSYSYVKFSSLSISNTLEI